MSANPQQFQGVLASVIASQDGEVTLAKQPVLADYGREVRAAISALPPDVSGALLKEYREPTPQLVTQMENAIISRELAIEAAEQGQGLDQEWLAGGGQGRKMDEHTLSAGDDWNTPEAG